MGLRRSIGLVCAVIGLGGLVLGGWSAAQFRALTAAAEAGVESAPRPAPLVWLGPAPFLPLIGLLLAAPAGFTGFVALSRRRPED